MKETNLGKVSILMPAFNEEERIIKNVEEVITTFKGFNCKYEIIVIDDGSTDTTYKKVVGLKDKCPEIIVCRNIKNCGKGEALKRGFRHVTGDFVVFLDADLELHPRQLSSFFDIMKEKNADVVIGSKRHPASRLRYPFYRQFLSSIYYLMVKILFRLPVRDTQTGLKLFKKEVLDVIFPLILVKQYAYDLEILALARHLGYKIEESPISLDYKRKWLRIGFKYLFRTFLDTLAVFFRLYVIRYYDRHSVNKRGFFM